MRSVQFFCAAIISCLAVSSCMKHSCYECKDEQGNIVNKGCDKTRDEVREFETNSCKKCTILPD